jgi:hypothetical protein
MPMDKFLIAPFNTGLQTNLKPWLIMDDAFDYLQNAWVFRGRVRKRFGSIWMGTSQLNTRLRVSLGANTGAAMNLPANTAAHTPQLAIGQIFSIDNTIFTVYQLGAGVATLTTTGGVTAVINSVAAPNTITITGGSVSPVYWYPSLPVMGITQYEINSVNNHPTYAFDTEFAYTFSGGAWARSGTAVWQGDDQDFFWSTNWQGSTTSATSAPVLFVTNFNATVPAPAATDDPIWTFDGATWTARSGANAFYFFPNGGLIQTGPYVKTARIIVAFKDRLLLLNTVENDNSGGAGVNTAYVNRCRFSFNGSPFARNAWYEPNQSDSSGGVVNNNNIAAGAGYIDAATEEQIISAEFIKDRLIVFFERSTWELAYTGSEILPFVWQKLNTELGSMSTFSSVPFDKDIITVGQTGVHACNGSNVVRIDDIIPDEIFKFSAQNNNTVRTFGIRDYDAECVYFAFVSNLGEPTQNFPNQVLLFNYKNRAWAVNDDCFTAFGYFEQISGTTWASSSPITWAEANYTWDSGLVSPNQRKIIGGTPEGFMLILMPQNVSRNAPSMSITNLSIAATGIITVTAIDHNLSASPTQFPDDADYVLFENVVGNADLMNYINGTIFPVARVIDADTFTVNTFGGLTSGTYAGGGTLARVSNVQIQTKEFNPYNGQDFNVTIQRVEFAVQKTDAGAITVDYYPSSSARSMREAADQTDTIMGTSVLETSAYDPLIYPFELTQSLLWHPVYLQSSGTTIQLGLYFNPDQMINPNVSLSDFELQGMLLVTQRCSSRLQ